MDEAEAKKGRKRRRRFRRSREERILSGFCGGLGEYFDIDPVLIRIGFIALFLLTAGECDVPTVMISGDRAA